MQGIEITDTITMALSAPVGGDPFNFRVQFNDSNTGRVLMVGTDRFGALSSYEPSQFFCLPIVNGQRRSDALTRTNEVYEAINAGMRLLAKAAEGFSTPGAKQIKRYVAYLDE